MIPTIRDRDQGVRRLMTAMLDLDVYDGWETLYRSRADAAPEFQQLYDGYLGLLEVALSEALRRWDGTVRATQEVSGGTYEDALVLAHERLWAGPGGDMNVIWVVRLIWLECALSNGNVAKEERVRPETLLLRWLIDDGKGDFVHLIACMPYWPIGLDENGNWC